MNKQNFYIIIIGVLILINLTLMWFFLNQNNSSKKGGPRDMIIEALHFDDEQIREYDLLITDHRVLMRKGKSNLYNFRKSYFLTDSDSALSLLSISYSNLESINKNHINDIMEICTASQKEDFRILIKENTLFNERKK
jgi:protein CpxP|tara:strand:+ start:148 stop:561 length:414 start_codon:yes stop_codon:yes gene_type:complete